LSRLSRVYDAPLLRFLRLAHDLMLTRPAEFDKQTSLGVKSAFPKAMHSANFIAESIAKDICAHLSRDVLAIVPQVADYTCTICN